MELDQTWILSVVILGHYEFATMFGWTIKKYN